MNRDTYKVEHIYYQWLCIGDIEVYVADLESNEDEKAIEDQIYAIGMGWTQ